MDTNEVRGQRLEIRGQRLEVRDQRLEVRGQRLKVNKNENALMNHIILVFYMCGWSSKRTKT